MKKIGLILSVFIVALFVAISCSDDNVVSTTGGNGTVNILLTDAPFPVDMVAKTIVAIDKVEIRKSATDSTEASFIVLSEESVDIDLLMLSNGVTEVLTSSELEAGKYDMIRMHVTDSKVILADEDSTEFDLKIPSGSSSGLKVKIEPALEIGEGQTADVLLDFDVCKSFVVKGNWKGGKINGFNFKPVVRGVLLGMTGRIEGNVADTTETALENVSVKVLIPSEEDSLLTTSFTDSVGDYKIIGLMAGSYTVVAELDGFIPDTIMDVAVSEGSSTVVDIELTPEAEEAVEEGGE